MRRGLDRRTLLRGGAAVAVALPWLEAFSRPARAQSAQPPRRLIVVFHGNGVNVGDWFPNTVGPDFELKASLQPLEAFRDRLLVTGGISNESAKDQSGNPHTKGAPHLLTGVPHIEGQFTAGGGGGFATDISFDQAIAEHIRGDTPIPSLLMGPQADEGANGETPRARLSYAGYNLPLTPEHRPAAIFEQLTMYAGDADGGDGAEAAAEAAMIRRQRRSVLDFVGDELGRLTPRLGSADRARLDEYLTHLRELEQAIPDQDVPAPQGCELPAEQEAVDDVKASRNLPVVTEQMFALAKVALQCDLTRVVTFQWGGAQSVINYSAIDEPLLAGLKNAAHHNVSHDGPFSDLTQIARWHSQKLADFCAALDGVAEGEGTLLDHSVVLYCNELSDGASHDFDNLPFVLLGGSGVLRTGQYLRFEGKTNNDLFLALFQAFGVERTSFGSPAYSTGPISGILS